MKQQLVFLLGLLVHIVVCVFSLESTHKTPHFHLRHHNMSVALAHDDDYTQEFFAAFSTEVASMKLDDNASPRREFRLTADSCDCGVLTGCRCHEALWDMVLDRIDESDMEEGMMDQGYRQHV